MPIPRRRKNDVKIRGEAVRVNFLLRLPDSLNERLDKAAAEENTSKAAIIRTLLDVALKTIARRRAARMARSVESADISLKS